MVICEKCNKRMPTARILELHLIKSHGGKNAEAETVIKPEEVKTVLDIAKPEVQLDMARQAAEHEPVEGMVEIESVDGRVLEVSVGSYSFKGKVIAVPRFVDVTDTNGVTEKINLEEEVRRLLTDGGFYVK
ncbi:hypothetical protein M0R04_12640 [Candidatus Dojkabacteria bacterium]|jgi:hypothetical protein|nr:hypothetical protein [Candidatus Dojkabacteria bacterium]